MNEVVNDNRKYGNKGFWSLLDDAQKQELMYEWQKQNWVYKFAEDYILKATGKTPVRKTLYSLRLKLKDRWEARNKQPEEEVDWADPVAIQANSNVPMYPPEILQQLYGMWEEIKRTVEENTDVAPIPFTYRKLKWLAFMYMIHGSKVKKTDDKSAIASMYAIREMVAEWTDSKMQREDLDDWLTYEPWRSYEHMQDYLDLIETGTIPDLEPSKFISSASELATNTDHLNVGNRATNYNLQGFLEALLSYEPWREVAKVTRANKYLLPTQHVPFAYPTERRGAYEH